MARVEETEIDRNSFTIINGKNGILVSVDKQSTANLVKVSERLQCACADSIARQLAGVYGDTDFLFNAAGKPDRGPFPPQTSA